MPAGFPGGPYHPSGPPLTGTRWYGMPMRAKYDPVFRAQLLNGSQPHRVARETEIDARVATEAPRVPWDEFVGDVLHWKADEHFALIGPTGQGKTTMLLNVLPLHPYVVIFATKPRDATMDSLATSGYLRMDRWRSLDAEQFPRRILWPDATRLSSEIGQKRIFEDAMDRIYREGGWTVAIDELWWISKKLKMENDIKTYLQQGRSLYISLLMATQRPANVPVEIYDQSTHIMFWRDNDELNLKRMGGIGWKSAALIRSVVANLEDHQVLYVNTRSGKMFRTRCPNVDPALYDVR